MIKRLAPYVAQYKKHAIFAPILLIGEVLMDTLIPFIIAKLIDQGIQAQNMSAIWKYGGQMVLCAFFSLFCGVMSSRLSAIATTGFAANVRQAIFHKIQT